VLSVFIQANDKQIKMIYCEPTEIFKCTTLKCEKFEVVNVDGAQYFEVDLEKKMLTGIIGKAQLKIDNIVSRHGNENTFIFFGTHADSKFDWILRIDKKTGKMILLSTNGDLDGFTTYGNCKWEKEK
jgi:hypothetical protein